MPSCSNTGNKLRVCLWCGGNVKKYYDKNGKFKRYLKTCGDEECLHKSMRQQHRRKQFAEELSCKICKKIFIASSPKQKTCKSCTPTKRDITLYRKYGITNKDFLDMLEKMVGHVEYVV